MLPTRAPSPSETLAAQLNRKHPEYDRRQRLWDKLSLMFAGGDDIAQRAAEFLLKRSKEPNDIYSLRLQRCWPQNIVGTVISWYVSALWKKEISIDRNPTPVSEVDDFYSAFLENCDNSQTKFTDFWADRIERALLLKRAFVLVDLPSVAQKAGNLKAQIQAGELDAYLVPYETKDVINWSRDRFGNLDWAVIKTTEVQQEFLGTPVSVTRWWYFDRQQYQVYESSKKQAEIDSVEDDDNTRLIDQGAHAMTAQNRVPLFSLELPDSQWLGHRMYLQALDHLNQDNSYAYALLSANVPLPVIKTLKDLAGMNMAEYTALQLEPGDSFEWNEPSGVSFIHSQARVDQLREEIYRTCYLQAQGRSGKATPAMQSGYSKELDMMPSRDVLNAIGYRVRAAMTDTLRAIATIRGDSVTFSIRAFNFEESDAVAELSLDEQLTENDFPSDTVRKYQKKRAARAILTDATEDEKTEAMAEIDASPTIDEQKQMQLEAQQLQLDKTFTRATAGIAQSVAAA